MLGPEKIAELTKSYPQCAIEALEEGNDERLRYYLTEMLVGQKEVDGLGLLTHINMHAFIKDKEGDEALHAMMEAVGVQLVKPYVGLYQQDEKAAFEEIIALYRNQTGAQLIPLKEDADEIEYQLSPCGSGGGFAAGEVYKTGHGLDEDGVPLLCKACNKWQERFNSAVGEEVWSMTPNPTVPGACKMTLRKQRSKGTDLFSKEELWLNAKPRSQQALEQLAMGNRDIRHLLENQLDEWKPWHDYAVRWLEYVFAWVAENYGMDYYDEFMAQCYDTAFSAIYGIFQQLESDEEAVAALAKVWHYHVAKFRVEEEENRFRFVLDPCGSGGRLYRGEMHLDSFHYGDELSPLVEGKHKIAFNREGAPHYCTHCASSNRDMFLGGPLVFVVDGTAQSRPGAACHQYLWKTDAPREVESRLLQQVGVPELLPLRQLD